MHTNTALINTYARAATLDKVAAGTYLNTRAQGAMLGLVRHAKVEKIRASRMAYKMRLNALVAADSRQGKTWP